MVALFFNGVFRIWEKIMQEYLLQMFRHYFIRIATVKLLQASRFFRLFCQTIIIEMPSLYR